MSYNLNNLSRTTLQKIFYVLEEIKLKSEIINRKRFLVIWIGELKNVKGNEQESVLLNLINDKVIKENKWLNFSFLLKQSYYILHIDNSFFDFFDKVKLQLVKIDKVDNTKKITSHKLSFDVNKSILYFMGYKIPITLKNSKPNAHYIFEHIFTAEDGLDQKYPYREIAEDTFDEIYEKWKIYYRACEDIERKVLNKTGVKDFLKFSTGKSGWVKINDKYLK
ncbi:MAG: hypothetical protein KAI26_09185 [Nanoarchaeota archaeon]|nr:hypothetical protein [Nanoarchaeota archaeon]